jgi:tRNA A-37 threonylcarbamoyl transferase component Bud32/DNA-binding NarL/FixJ family response regulator
MRVLVVDENADFRLVLAEYLREGHALAGATTPLEIRDWDPSRDGVPSAASGFRLDFDVILIDSGIGNDDPLEWLKSVRRAYPYRPPVVLLTGGRDSNALVVEAMRQGVSGVLSRLELSPTRLFGALDDARNERRLEQTMERSLATGSYERAAPAAAVDPGLPRIPGYALERMIGEGGTARVYMARRESDGMRLVLKVLLPELMGETRVVERFMQEFSLVQKVQSAYVTRIFDLAYDHGAAYLAMEYFGAGDLRERMREGLAPLPALKLFAQIARALDAIHDAGIIHRDLKPHNIMFRDRHHLAIVDFGGAKVLDEDSGITRVGQVVGTPNYMSPEQILGQKLDARSDLYSLGVILHQLLTGKPLYVARTTAELMDMHVHAPVPRLPANLAGFQSLLGRLVAKDRNQRFASARELYAHIVA